MERAKDGATFTQIKGIQKLKESLTTRTKMFILTEESRELILRIVRSTRILMKSRPKGTVITHDFLGRKMADMSM